MSTKSKYASKLVGARVLIIGGTAGVGLAVAEASVELGAATVIISSSNPNRIDAAEAEKSRAVAGA
ncbi:Glucose/ribitol dehydrogenase [Ilyonectria robusta]